MADHSLSRLNVVSDHSDHHFHTTNTPKKHGGDSFTNDSSAVHKKIMREWKILKENLPETITVHVYEQRIDLLRAAISGAVGTPYHNNLFFFDLAFPSDYPNQPPKLHYHSFGHRINPNLYENGKVCLSLLNTWRGSSNEKWDPSKSTILQVLLSIQALVLCEKPYFNEPAFKGLTGKFWENNARRYDEIAFVISCKTMLLLIRTPPRGFKEFVVGHFREHGNVVLGACKAYANGKSRVGNYHYYRDGSDTGSGSKNVPKVSNRFRDEIVTIYPQLFEAFRGTGAALGVLDEHLQLEEMKKAKGGIISKISNKLLKWLGCN